jgi:hypothetical protein
MKEKKGRDRKGRKDGKKKTADYITRNQRKTCQKIAQRRKSRN